MDEKTKSKIYGIVKRQEEKEESKKVNIKQREAR